MFRQKYLRELAGLTVELRKNNYILSNKDITHYKLNKNSQTLATYHPHSMNDYLELFKILNTLYCQQKHIPFHTPNNQFFEKQIENLSHFVIEHDLDLEKLKRLRFFEKLGTLLIPCMTQNKIILNFHKSEISDFDLMVNYFIRELFTDSGIHQMNFLADNLTDLKNIKNILLLDF